MWTGLSACSSNPQEKPETNLSETTSTKDSASTIQPKGSDKQDSSFQIIPGQRIGQISLGQSPEDLVKALGPPDSTDAAMGKALLTWFSKSSKAPRQEVTVYTVRENTGMANEQVGVRQVRITSPEFTIPDNYLKTGSSLPQIRKVYPSAKAVAYYLVPGNDRVYVYDVQHQGIAFEVSGADSVCVAITIHPKGKGVQEEYLPLHPDIKLLQ
ncbi:hypothetical protein TH61_04175 [Rufibacter sp. DG15C]|nr:hypothetical protein TH61_04175 [Rufibacter sp. DG15C]